MGSARPFQAEQPVLFLPYRSLCFDLFLLINYWPSCFWPVIKKNGNSLWLIPYGPCIRMRRFRFNPKRKEIHFACVLPVQFKNSVTFSCFFSLPIFRFKWKQTKRSYFSRYCPFKVYLSTSTSPYLLRWQMLYTPFWQDNSKQN